MSKEKAEKFLTDVNTDSTLQKKLLGAAADAKAWIAEAASAGYDMTVDELRAAAEHVAGKPVTTENLIGTLRGLLEGEMDDASLDAVAGGLATAQPTAKPTVQPTVKLPSQVLPGTRRDMS